MARLVIGTSKAVKVPAVVRDKSPESYRAFQKDADGKLVTSTSTPWVPLPAGTTDVDKYLFYTAYYSVPANVLSGVIDLSSLKSISGAYAFCQTFRYCTGITGVDLSSLKSIGGGTYCCEYMFNGCTGITSVDLSSLVYIKQDYCARGMFQGCTGITGALDLSSLIMLSGRNTIENMFNSCTGITSVNLSGLLSAAGNYACQYTFSRCTNLASVDLSHLCKLGTNNNLQQTFENTALTSLSFPNLAYTSTNYNSAFNNTLKGVTGCTVHFPSDWQTTMSSWANITNGMGGTNTTVSFDLPAVTTLDWSHITSIDQDSMLYGLAQNNFFPNVTSVNLGGLREVVSTDGFRAVFKGCSGITSINLSSLEKVSGRNACDEAFCNCTGLTSVNLSSLVKIDEYMGCSGMFNGCTNLASVDLSSLEEVSSSNGCFYMFSATALTSVSFPLLKTLTGSSALSNTFKDCTSLTSLSFPALTSNSFGFYTSQFDSMLYGVTGCTVHFPSNLQSVISRWTSVILGFNGTNTTVLYDLPATE